MKREDVNLKRVYYFLYSNEKTPAILVPIRTHDSQLGSKGHFWTEGYFYDSAAKKWYHHESNWTIGNEKSYTEIEKVDQQIIRESIESLFELGIQR
jgi:hypothetical protein